MEVGSPGCFFAFFGSEGHPPPGQTPEFSIFGQGPGGSGWVSRGGVVLGIWVGGLGCSYQMEYRSIPVAGWPSESWPWARPCTWRHSQALGAVFDHSPMAHPVKVCLTAGYSSGSRHPSKGWVRPKQAGWEFRVKGSGFRV